MHAKKQILYLTSDSDMMWSILQ